MTDAQLSVFFTHCVTVFDAMAKRAERDEAGQIIYSGFLTKLFHELELPTPYYSKITKLLRDMGCIYQLTRGGGSASRPSRWILHRPPSREAFIQASQPPDPALVLSARQLSQMALDLVERVNRLEEKAK